MIKVAIVQMTSTNNLEANLVFMENAVAEAAQKGAKLIAFPELAYFAGRKREWLPLIEQYDKLASQFSSWAKKYSIPLIPGTVREPVIGEREKFHNTLLTFDPTGKQIAKYRKLFLFKATLPELHYDESTYSVGGSEITVTPFLETNLGLAICFDLRFPELFRSLRKRGSHIVVIPTSFTVTTGRVHWDALTRARAIENLNFLIAPCQVGQLGDGEEKYGHSRVISPWGKILVDMESKCGVSYCDINLDEVSECEQKLHAWSMRREDLFPIA